jgi:regulator of replication initiation timing
MGAARAAALPNVYVLPARATGGEVSETTELLRTALVEADRLRAYWLEAQTEVNRLRAENAKLREALAAIANAALFHSTAVEQAMRKVALDALAGAAEVKHE